MTLRGRSLRIWKLEVEKTPKTALPHKFSILKGYKGGGEREIEETMSGSASVGFCSSECTSDARAADEKEAQPGASALEEWCALNGAQVKFWDTNRSKMFKRDVGDGCAK